MIIPKLDAQGRHIKANVQPGEYYCTDANTYRMWPGLEPSKDIKHIYIEVPDGFMPKYGETFYYYDFEKFVIVSEKWNDTPSKFFLIKIGNCFRTTTEVTMPRLYKIYKMSSQVATHKAPELGDVYFYHEFDSPNPGVSLWGNTEIDNRRLSKGNCFKTAKEITPVVIKKIIANYLAAIQI